MHRLDVDPRLPQTALGVIALEAARGATMKGWRAAGLRRRATDRAERSGERGSALVVAVLVSVIMALLGISCLLRGETEARIAQNEKRAAQALYLAEAGARAVKRWFDHPGSALGFPPAAVADRTLRRIVDESDPYDPAAATPADGVIGSFPYYKQNVDLDSDGRDDLFDRPFRPGSLHALMGTEDGPDLRIDEGDASARAYLDQLTQALAPGFPDEGGGVYARIARIDVFAPPYIEVAGTWSRYGLATVKVVSRLYGPAPGGERIIAEREVEAVLGEAPYRGPHGPLHSCESLTFTNAVDLGVRWGAMAAVRRTKLSLGPAPAMEPLCSRSLPREEPAAPGVDPLWNGVDPARFLEFRDAIDGVPIEDPWLRILSGESIFTAPAGVQPWPPDPVPPPGEAPDYCCDHSGVAQNVPLVTCPSYDYAVWKLIAGSGESDVRYFVWSGGASFRENGTGPALDFETITNGQEGIYFFETRDNLPPADVTGNGRLDNLTPQIVVNRAGWRFRGFLFVNATEFRIDSVPAATTEFRAPGEPFQDADQDGAYDAGEAYINLDYAATLDGASVADRADAYGGAVMRNERGPAIVGPVSLEGILYTSGSFEATGNGVFYGSVIALGGVTQGVQDGSQPTPKLYWDASIADSWPPDGWKLPRTVVTGWRTLR